MRSLKNWDLDAVGNWNSSTSGTTTTTRTHDLQNEGVRYVNPTLTAWPRAD